MDSRFFDRSRSRTRAPSSRPSTHQPTTDTFEKLPQHVPDPFSTRSYYSRPPARHVLAIIDFRGLAELANTEDAQSKSFDLLAESNFEFCGYIEIASLFLVSPLQFQRSLSHPCWEPLQSDFIHSSQYMGH